MSTEENKAIVRRWRDEIWNKHNVNAIDDLHAPDYVGHYSGIGTMRGREELKRFFATYLAAFDIDVEPQFLIAEGDMVVTHDTIWGKHTGTFRGIPPTGKQVTSTGTDIYRIEGGKIVEQWYESDFTGAMQQLGVLPTPAPAERIPQATG